MEGDGNLFIRGSVVGKAKVVKHCFEVRVQDPQSPPYITFKLFLRSGCSAIPGFLSLVASESNEKVLLILFYGEGFALKRRVSEQVHAHHPLPHVKASACHRMVMVPERSSRLNIFVDVYLYFMIFRSKKIFYFLGFDDGVLAKVGVF
jgi:hypothetical protein